MREDRQGGQAGDRLGGGDRSEVQRRSSQGGERANMPTNTKAPSTATGFTVSSPVVKKGGALPAEYTGDGTGASMPVEWNGAPAGAKSYALSLWHVAPDREKSYWVVYDIPADVKALPQNAKGIGTVGYNDQNRREYMPMRSKGGGAKEYNITVFALSEKPQFSADKVTRADLLAAIEGITLAEDTLTYTYERPQTGDEPRRGRQ
jgi:phosphatidylethanolamine-binding protein (PEBP) family uncharacterized protein